MNILPVNAFQETLNAGMCGPASLKMVLSYFSIEKSESELAELCGTTHDLGTDDIQIKTAAEYLGLHVEIKNDASFEDVQRWLEKGVPVIVDWFSTGINVGPETVPDGHYSVVVGLDENHIYLMDPEIGGLRTLKREDFYKVWFDFSGPSMMSPEDLILRQIIAVFPVK